LNITAHAYGNRLVDDCESVLSCIAPG